MTQQRQLVPIDELKAMLIRQVERVVLHYAPLKKGSYRAFGKYFTLNPGRADRRVGSFYVHMSGARAGNWCDHAVPNEPGIGYGDIIDLIALSCGCDLKGAVREARAFLGLETLAPEDLRKQREHAKKLQGEMEQLKQQEAWDRQDRARKAFGLWLSGREHLRGTPVDFYLKGRGLDLARLGRAPRAIRYLPKCRYYHEDEETGEVFEGAYPAMCGLISNAQGKGIAAHLTWLGLDRNGRWGKAPVPQPKKVRGDYAGASIKLWRGIGPRGGKPASLNQCSPGTHVMIAEGIEDALSAIMLCPEERAIAAISLSNFGAVHLPANVSSVTLIGDRDQNDTARDQLDHAIALHQAAGREVRLWQNNWGGKDLNDALQCAETTEGKGAA